MTEAYPLAWPAGRPRTPAGQRRRTQFKTRREGNGWLKSITVAVARERLSRELERLGARYTVLSTNMELRLDGQPRSDRAEPSDPGVALYFRLGDKPHCMPCDKWDTVGGNIAAIAGHIEALRAIERYGVQSLEEAFSGFVALPEPGNRPWRDVLECRNQAVTLDLVEAMYRRLARERHPDLGGSDEMMAELNAAIESARADLKEGR